MKKHFLKKIGVILLSTVMGLSCLAMPVSAYNGANAATYAKKWYNGQNPQYNDYSGSGGDCTNFVSQCVLAGGGAKKTPSYINPGEVVQTRSYWYSFKFIRTDYFFGFQVAQYPVWSESTSWIRVAGGYGFYDYWKNTVGKTVIITKNLSYLRSQARVGDVIQVQAQGSSAKGHSTIVGSKTSSEITLYYHSNNTCRTLASFDENYGKGRGTNTYTLIRM